MIDITIVIIYFIALLLYLGVKRSSDKKDFNSFASPGKVASRSSLILVASIFVSSIGGGTTFGISEKAFAGNIAYSYGLALAIPVDILIAIYIVPRLAKHQGAKTVGDIMAKYYGLEGRYISGFAAIAVSTGLLAAQISVSGRIFEYILGINYFMSVIVSYLIVVIYTSIGGFRSVLFASQLQFFAILFAIPVISFCGLYKVGVVNFMNLVPAEKFSFYANENLLSETVAAALGFAVINLLPTFIQRALINKDSQKTKRAIYIKSMIYVIFLVFITINGLLAYIQYPNIKASLSLPYMINEIIPVGLQGIVVVGLLCAVMSTADSDLNITSITLTKDFIKPIFALKNQEILLRITRIINIVIGVLAIVIALCFDKVVDLVIFMTGFWGPVILPALIFAMFGIVIRKQDFVLASFLGLGSFLIWQVLFAQQYLIKAVFVGTFVNCLVFLICKFGRRA